MDDPSRNNPTPPPRQQLLLHLREILAKWAGVHLKGFIDKLDHELFRLADRAGNNAEQTRYWQTRAELNSHREQIERRMSERLRDAFQAFVERRDTWDEDEPPTPADPTDLRLVEEEALEQRLAIASMSQRAQAEYSEALYALQQRLSVLASGYKVSERGNPVAPRVFAEALDAGLAGLAIDNRARLLIYKLYESQLMQRLGKLYELLNHQLKSEGVLPNLRHTIRKDAEPVNTGIPVADAASQDNQRQLMAMIRELQAAAGVLPVQTAAGAISGVQLVATLGGLQRQSSGRLAAAHSADTVIVGAGEMEQELRSETGQAVDADVIEIVGLLFEYMLNDDQLPDSVKALLSYLHTPFLRVALLDKAFFNSPQHPARQLLNSLAAAGERWVEPDGKHKSDVFQQMRTVVQRVLDEFDRDVSLFSELLADFHRFLRRYAERIRRAEQRAREAARGEDRLKEGRLEVERFLHQRCAGLPLSRAARNLLFGPWAHYQAFVWLRFGTDSDPWREAEATVDALLRYLDAPRDELAERSLLQGLRAGLNTVGYDRAKGDALLQALLQGGERETEVVPAPAPQPVVPPADDPELRALTRLEFGTWFLFGADLPRKQHKRLKLAWFNDRTLHFMFVNRLGQQVAVKQGEALARELREGRTRVLGNLDDKPFFEKALERIAEQLKGGRKSNTTRSL